jgi:hypothetical protein
MLETITPIGKVQFVLTLFGQSDRHTGFIANSALCFSHKTKPTTASVFSNSWVQGLLTFYETTYSQIQLRQTLPASDVVTNLIRFQWVFTQLKQCSLTYEIGERHTNVIQDSLLLLLWLYSPLLSLGRFFSFLIPYTVGRTPWTGDQPVARPLPTHRTT